MTQPQCRLSSRRWHNVLTLSATDKEFEFSGSNAETPDWSHVEICIKRAFQFGGRVQLDTQDPSLIGSGLTRTPWWTYTVGIAMESKVGRARLIATTKRLNEKGSLREWWEPGDSPFRGTERFSDDEWDARTVCTDVSVIKKIFKDLFDHGELTEPSFSQMRSVWDRKPRV